MSKLTKLMSLLCVATAISFSPMEANAKTILKSESTAAGDPGYILFVLMNNYLRNAGKDIEIQIGAGNPMPRSMLLGTKGELDLYPVTWIATKWMQDRDKLFKNVENAPELVKDLRSIFSYQGGAYHVVVFDDSDIQTLDDIRGKKVFVGPKGGAAGVMIDLMVHSSTSMTADDYDAINLDWGGGAQAMQDGQLDVFFRPTTVGSEIISQVATKAPIRLLGMPEKAFEDPEVKELLTLPGRTVDEIKPNTYRNQTNTDSVQVLGYWQGVGARKDLDPDIVYDVTKAFWENLEETKKTAPFMQATNADTVFNHMAAPLHVGAYRYYKEIGLAIPDELVPPEAK